MTKNHFIIADHIRASCFLISDGVMPGPKQQGYILRRLIRRSLSASMKLNIDISNQNYFHDLVKTAIKPYQNVYPELEINQNRVVETLLQESGKYQGAVKRGQSEWTKELKKIDSVDKNQLSKHLALKTWDLYQTHGVPIEISLDVLEENDLVLDQKELDKQIEEHQKLSQTTSAGQFKSGLGEQNETTTKLHTATHLLHQTLREVLGDYVEQRGSAITSEKARFDFTAHDKLTDVQLEQIKTKVQSLIDAGLIVEKAQMSDTEARELGAIGLFGEKYGETVTVYTVHNDQGKVFSREFCGGPHVKNTNEIGTFTILKQESLGSGLRRLNFMVS
jgi:alanyl-tRNA synthetase